MIEFVSFPCAGYVDASYQYDAGGFQLADLESMDDDDRDVIGSSQLGGAPPIQSQDPAFQTPEPPVRPARQTGPASRLTYPTGHVHAQQRGKRTRRDRGG